MDVNASSCRCQYSQIAPIVTKTSVNIRAPDGHMPCEPQPRSLPQLVIRRCENTRRVRPLTQDETSLQVLSDSWAPTATVSNDAFASSCHLTLRRPFVELCELNSAVQPYYALLCVIFTAMQWKSQFWFLKEPFSDHLKNKVLYWHWWFHWRVFNIHETFPLHKRFFI